MADDVEILRHPNGSYRLFDPIDGELLIDDGRPYPSVAAQAHTHDGKLFRMMLPVSRPLLEEPEFLDRSIEERMLYLAAHPERITNYTPAED